METQASDIHEESPSSSAEPQPVEHWEGLRKTGWIILLVLAVGIFMDRITFNRLLGAQWAIFVNLLLLLVFIAAKLEHRTIPWRIYLLAIPISLTAILTYFRLEPYTLIALVVFSLVGLVYMAISLLNGQWMVYRLREVITQGLRLIGSAFIGLPAALIQSSHHEENENMQKKPKGNGLAILRGILIAIPLLIIFALLFAQADPIFSERLASTFAWLRIEITDEVVAQVVLVLLFTYFGFGALWHALTKTQQQQPVEPDQPLVRPFLGMTESTIILASLIVLFGAFVLVQVRYFFGGGANISAEGYTYAEYARRGFFELVVVALFTWLVHYGLSSFTRRESRRERTTFTLLGGLLLLLTGVILVSAFQRLSLYEAAYGFTRDRLVAHIFMIFIGLALAISIILEVTRGLKHMALSLLLGLLAFSLTLTFVNVDATIARQNLEHAIAGHPLDAAYLAGMTISEDAVPELFRYFDSGKLSPELHEELGNVISCRRARYWDRWYYNRFWASQHASRAKALELYQAHKQALDPFALIGYQEGAGYTFPDGKVICVYPPEE